MTTSEYIATASLLVAFSAFIYAYLTNTKKYELTSLYRVEILSWYSETIEILVRLRIEATDNFKDNSVKKELLSKLSAKIEIGRFYFPNVDKGDKFGEEKPLAYKGYRNLMLEFLVFSYQLFERQDTIKFIKHAETLQRHFTSQLFEIIDPKNFLKETKKHTDKTFSKELAFEDFIKEEPNALDLYL
jgi:hypothetical protein